ncbi:hypothetical protein [Tardiphaga sp. 813_E8_N1_3]|uniref:hypothetical protein n=1 Tax=Tardiphaga sp. 813_E8_N1_3 TaxID=3240760 RepID=UPI003F25AE7B
MNPLSDFFTAIGYIVVGAGALGTFVWWLFRTFSEKWLNSKFEERLAAYKHEQQKELEHLKFAINTQMDRATKLHQREFEALPEAWARLMDAHGYVASLVSRYQSTPDLNRMRADELKEFIQNSKLADWQRQLVLEANNKTDAYKEQIEPFKVARANKASRRFYLYFRKNGIFLRDPLKKQFEELDQMILSALSEHRMNFQHQTREFKAIDKLASDGEQLVKKLETEVQSKLWDAVHKA